MMTEKTAGAPAPIPNIHARMVSIIRELDAIGKDRNNAQQGFKYRGIDQVYNALNPLLAKYGVYMSAEVLGKDRQERTTQKGGILAFTSLRMRYHFHAEDGSSVFTEAEGEGMDSGDKSSNKAMAIAHKYAILQAFCVPTEDITDPDAEVHEVAPRTRAEPEFARSPADEFFERAKIAISNQTDLTKLHAWVQDNLGHLNALPAEQGKALRDQYERRTAALAQAPNLGR